MKNTEKVELAWIMISQICGLFVNWDERVDDGLISEHWRGRSEEAAAQFSKWLKHLRKYTWHDNLPEPY